MIEPTGIVEPIAPIEPTLSLKLFDKNVVRATYPTNVGEEIVEFVSINPAVTNTAEIKELMAEPVAEPAIQSTHDGVGWIVAVACSPMIFVIIIIGGMAFFSNDY